MPDHRYYFPGDFASEVLLEDKEHRHLATVMRSQVGQEVEIVNGKGVLAHATIAEIGKKETRLTVTEIKATPPLKPLILAQAITRGSKLDFIVEKVTELGCTEIWLFPADRGECKEFKQERLEAVSIAAMKQCGRLWLPKIVAKGPLKKWEKPALPLVYGDPEGTHKMEGSILAIGPESGWSFEELKALKKLGAGARFHENILRTETAAIAGIALLYKM